MSEADLIDHAGLDSVIYIRIYLLGVPWSQAIIVKVFGRTVGYGYPLSRISTMWKPDSELDCVDLRHDYFPVRFDLVEHLEDYRRVLNEGQLPIKFYEVEILKRIGRRLGNIIDINAHMEASSRGWFARFCVQVNLYARLIPNVHFGGVWKDVAFELLSSLCFTCYCIGYVGNLYLRSIVKDRYAQSPSNCIQSIVVTYTCCLVV
ncbi:hypothetical protein L1049_021364 [Liquidambar formosana]|uniref:Uncharacterized protein n=1 Tax=Liquidambar formosana TaxID=63359 RepID=A0AAP0SDZ4_LIQFO